MGRSWCWSGRARTRRGLVSDSSTFRTTRSRMFFRLRPSRWRISSKSARNDWRRRRALSKRSLDTADDSRSAPMRCRVWRAIRQRLDAAQIGLATYERLRTLGGVLVSGLPARIAGQLGALTLFERQKDSNRSSEMARSISADLSSARWPIPRSAYLTVENILKAWIDPETQPGPDRLLSETISEFWSRPRPADSRSGRASNSAMGGESALVVWRTDASTTVAMAIPITSIARDWLPAGGRVVLTDEGRVVGGVPGSGRAAVRLASLRRCPGPSSYLRRQTTTRRAPCVRDIASCWPARAC